MEVIDRILESIGRNTSARIIVVSASKNRKRISFNLCANQINILENSRINEFDRASAINKSVFGKIIVDVVKFFWCLAIDVFDNSYPIKNLFSSYVNIRGKIFDITGLKSSKGFFLGVATRILVSQPSREKLDRAVENSSSNRKITKIKARISEDSGELASIIKVR